MNEKSLAQNVSIWEKNLKAIHFLTKVPCL